MIYYIGDGSRFFPGVSMRDMSDDEWAAIPEADRQAMLNAKLFSTKKPPAGKPEAQPDAAPAPEPAKGG